MKNTKKSLVLLLIFVLALSLFPQSVFAAKKKVKLNKKTVTVNVGKTVKIKLKNNKKKVKWTVISGKKNVSLSKKGKTSVTIKGKKAGKAKVQAKIGKKKYVCKVTVKNPKKTQSVKKTPAATDNSSGKTGQTAAPSVTNNPQNSTSDDKKIVSISLSSESQKYVFIEKGYKLVDKDNRGTENDEIDISKYNLQWVDVKYADGSERKNAFSNDVLYDFSQINYNQIGTYKLKISWDGCSCEVPVVVAEEKQEGLFTYLTDGNVAELHEMRGDIEIEDDDYSYKYSGTTLSIPEMLGGAKVVQGTPNYRFSTDNIEKVEFPKYYVEIAQSIAGNYYGKYFPKLKEVVINNPDSGYIVKDNVLFAEDGEVICLYPAGLQNTNYCIPEGVKEETDYGMGTNQYLKELTYPASFIGHSQRRNWGTENPGCSSNDFPNLEAINVESGNQYWLSKEGVLYNKVEDNKLILVAYPIKKSDISFIVDENVKGILYSAMGANTFLENITFKSGNTYPMDGSLNGDCIKNIYLDFQDEDMEEIGALRIEFDKFCWDNLDTDYDERTLPDIYIRSGVSLDHIRGKKLQEKVQYY